MKCPFCAELENKVIDSRLSNQGAVIRRRRECLGCERRFTTYERVEEILPMVVKKDGRRENFDRQKVIAGIQLACQKRPISSEQIEAVVDGIERRLQEMGEKEVPSSFIGESVMRELSRLDEVASLPSRVTAALSATHGSLRVMNLNHISFAASHALLKTPTST